MNWANTKNRNERTLKGCKMVMTRWDKKSRVVWVKGRGRGGIERRVFISVSSLFLYCSTVSFCTDYFCFWLLDCSTLPLHPLPLIFYISFSLFSASLSPHWFSSHPAVRDFFCLTLQDTIEVALAWCSCMQHTNMKTEIIKVDILIGQPHVCVSPDPPLQTSS